jgi:hypothetical protein
VHGHLGGDPVAVEAGGEDADEDPDGGSAGLGAGEEGGRRRGGEEDVEG